MVGIDLGTTYSLISLWTTDGQMLVKNALGTFQTPSVVGTLDDGTLVVGASAKERLWSHPDKTVACFKRQMGTDHIHRLGPHSF